MNGLDFKVKDSLGRLSTDIQGWLNRLELDVLASPSIGRDMISEDCAFRAFEGGIGGDGKPW